MLSVKRIRELKTFYYCGGGWWWVSMNYIDQTYFLGYQYDGLPLLFPWCYCCSLYGGVVSKVILQLLCCRSNMNVLLAGRSFEVLFCFLPLFIFLRIFLFFCAILFCSIVNFERGVIISRPIVWRNLDMTRR